MTEPRTRAGTGTERAALTSEQLVFHVIPTAAGRGAQREARALADRLDSPGSRRHRVVSLFEGPDDVSVDICLGHPGRGRPGQGFEPALPWSLRSLIGNWDPSLLVAHGSEPLKYLVPAMLLSPRPVTRPLAYYAIGTYSGETGRRPQLDLWRLLLRRADVVVAEGEEVKEECIRMLGVRPGRIHFVPNGRDPGVFRPREPDLGSSARIPVLQFVGALTHGKAPDRFLEVVSRLRARALQFRAEMVGDGPLQHEVRRQAAKVGVAVLGSRPDVAELLRQSDVLVFPSRPAGEGMPGVLIEAGLSGLPVVATDVPGVSTIVDHGHTGFVVSEGAIEEMAQAAGRLLTEPALRAEMGRAARRRCVERFGLDQVARQWLDVLEPLLLPHPRSRGSLLLGR